MLVKSITYHRHRQTIFTNGKICGQIVFCKWWSWSFFDKIKNQQKRRQIEFLFEIPKDRHISIGSSKKIKFTFTFTLRCTLFIVSLWWWVMLNKDDQMETSESTFSHSNFICHHHSAKITNSTRKKNVMKFKIVFFNHFAFHFSSTQITNWSERNYEVKKKSY